MASEPDYRAEARAARKSSRETLIGFREARRRARNGAGPADRSSAQETDVGGSISPDMLFDMSTGAAEDEPSQAHQPETEIETQKPSDDKAHSKVAAKAGAISETASKKEKAANAKQDRTRKVDLSDTGDPPGSGAEEDAGSVAEQTLSEDSPISDPSAYVAADCDLFRLPGAGAGIVWMFQQCGIRSLSDLAQADAAEVSAQLGVVGHILSIQPWIDFARSEGTPAGHSGPV